MFDLIVVLDGEDFVHASKLLTRRVGVELSTNSILWLFAEHVMGQRAEQQGAGQALQQIDPDAANRVVKCRHRS